MGIERNGLCDGVVSNDLLADLRRGRAVAFSQIDQIVVGGICEIQMPFELPLAIETMGCCHSGWSTEVNLNGWGRCVNQGRVLQMCCGLQLALKMGFREEARTVRSKQHRNVFTFMPATVSVPLPKCMGMLHEKELVLREAQDFDDDVLGESFADQDLTLRAGPEGKQWQKSPVLRQGDVHVGGDVA